MSQRFHMIDLREPVPNGTQCEMCNDGTLAKVVQVDISVYGPGVEPTKKTYLCANHGEVTDDTNMHFYTPKQ